MLINIGFGNTVHSDKVLAVVSPSAAPVKRLISVSREAGRLIDATQGRKTKAVIIMDNDRVVLSALQPETISKRFNGNSGGALYSGKDPDEEMSENE